MSLGCGDCLRCMVHGAPKQLRMYIPVKIYADPCPFGEENGENTTRNAASAALLNED